MASVFPLRDVFIRRIWVRMHDNTTSNQEEPMSTDMPQPENPLQDPDIETVNPSEPMPGGDADGTDGDTVYTTDGDAADGGDADGTDGDASDPTT
jgi:hypothetical protein